MKKYFRITAKVTLVLIYLVILAGAVVRMTGSGMGCPDWPRCFGYFIPPTQETQLQWQAEKTYDEGRIIIKDETLLVAKEDFKTKATFNTENWTPYTKHEYAQFNPIRTWIEYINRLVTVVLGFPVLLMTILSFWLFKKDKVLTIGAISTSFLLIVEAILGKLVVDTNLKPTMVSVHLILALLIMIMVIYLIYRTERPVKQKAFNKGLLRLLVLAAIITFVQIVIGIQVRQFVDQQIIRIGETSEHLWLQSPSAQFYVHRSFSIAVALLNLFLAYRIYKSNLDYRKINWVVLLILLEVVTGMAMYYLNFPFATQPVHLVLASLLLGVQFYLVLEALNSKRSHKTL